MLGDLGRGALDPDLGAEVDPQFEGGLAGLGKGLGLDDDAQTHVDLEKIVETDGLGGLAHWNSAGSARSACPPWPTTICSTRSRAASSRFWQWAFSAAPR